MLLEWITNPEAWIALFTLTALEIVLGIDNIIFISILVSRLPQTQRQLGRLLGLSLAMTTRILLLLSLAWIMRLTTPLFSLSTFSFSGRDLILIIGGLFLLFKSTIEIHHNIEEAETAEIETKKKANFLTTLLQIALLDIVFSLDSVITAVGMAKDIEVMILAIMLAVFVMMFAAKAIGEFVDSHPTLKILALSFLTLIGISLVAEGLSFHIPKGYIYFAMSFSTGVELINIKLRKKTKQKK